MYFFWFGPSLARFCLSLSHASVSFRVLSSPPSSLSGVEMEKVRGCHCPGVKGKVERLVDKFPG